ncbi:MAG: hypothetical protein [Sclerotinia sclerotiorum negative-stranded RNA virus 10]|uniref:Uncharacterized protein n=1 Tax=Sclerotinia sclerotiorum negative-stranded RNA virus 10 TaxID=2822963 RepID=A0AA45L1G1_9MONO|nr:MAG: hypothetical protein [Sclerotinia sclerotiorum negative-stranded RNA virus 10]
MATKSDQSISYIESDVGDAVEELPPVRDVILDEDGDMTPDQSRETQVKAREILGLVSAKAGSLKTRLANPRANMFSELEKLGSTDLQTGVKAEEPDDDVTPTLSKKQQKKLVKETESEVKLSAPNLEPQFSKDPEKTSWAEQVEKAEEMNSESGSEAEAFRSDLSREELVRLVQVQASTIEHRNTQIEQLMAKIQETMEYSRKLSDRVNTFETKINDLTKLQTKTLNELAMMPKYPSQILTPHFGSTIAPSEISDIAPSTIPEATVIPTNSDIFQRKYVFDE